MLSITGLFSCGQMSKNEKESDKANSPWSGSAFLQRGGCVGSIGESTLGGHDQ